MFLKWLPWKYVVRRVARAQGFVDPVRVLARLHQLAKPSEVAAPVELLRAGVVFHARGLMNAGVIQHNKDWIWPYWVERQFDPKDESFLPRAFSVTHVNLTHRNWTAIGIPGCDELPIVDPRGLLTPYWDSWSVDGWIFQKNGVRLIPSRHRIVNQELRLSGNLAVSTETQHGCCTLKSLAEVATDTEGNPRVLQRFQACSGEPACLVLSLRPYNPEGVSFVHRIQADEDLRGWTVGDYGRVRFSTEADEHFTSDYKSGDVACQVWSQTSESVECPVGMATAAAVFHLEPGIERDVALHIPLEGPADHHWMGDHDRKRGRQQFVTSAATLRHGAHSWDEQLDGLAELDVPDERFRLLHDAALRTVVLHTPHEVYPGPYTYKRFWVRDTAFILHSALCVGMLDRVTRTLPQLFKRQDSAGYFHSQEGEWDANGQALWLVERYLRLSNQSMPEKWASSIRRAARWIDRKRVTDPKSIAHGLLPAGFSAEHLGPNDFYYWDDFWAVAGLRAASRLMRGQDPSRAAAWQEIADEIATAIDHSLERTDSIRRYLAYPAAPERRMDAGAIGSVVAAYPLQLVRSDDPRLQGTIDFLMNECMVDGAFFQDMIHSGMNPYLTLHIAQALMRSGDSRSFELINSVAKLASPTGQWPEAIHPRTLGGCMGDGQHVWAAAEWLMAVRNMFVREEQESLVLGSGIPAHWHYAEETLGYGPTWTPWGKLKIKIQFGRERTDVVWDAAWHDAPPAARIEIPSFETVRVDLTEASGHVSVQASHAYDETGV